MIDGHDVELIGEINDAEKPDFLSGAIALLVPIDWPEPFGLVMIEAMACGTPVIAFNRGSVPEIVEHGVTGLIAEDEAEAVVAMRRVPSRPGAVVRRPEQRFTAQRMAEDYLALYRRLAARASGAAYRAVGLEATMPVERVGVNHERRGTSRRAGAAGSAIAYA
jgi:glycosyltransferase involved in cell wall biosynthesis